MKRLMPCITIPAVALLAGCANTAVETVVNSDGTWKRKVELRVMRQDEKAGQGVSVTPSLKLEDIFVAPAGPAWAIRKAKEAGEDVLSFERTLRAGEGLVGDVTLKAGPAKTGPAPRIVNRVTIRTLAPGRMEYRETLHYTGTPSTSAADLKDFKDMPVDEWVKAGLPARLATPANAKRFAQQVLGSFMDALFGPPDPLLDQILFSPGAARFRLTNRLGPLVVTALKDTFGDQMSGPERVAAARKMLASAGESMGSSRDKKMEGQMSGKPGAAEDSSTPVFLGFAVRLPGRVVETNGIRDDVTGTVSWGLYSLAPMLKDVEMRAVCDISR